MSQRVYWGYSSVVTQRPYHLKAQPSMGMSGESCPPPYSSAQSACGQLHPRVSSHFTSLESKESASFLQ